jgi:hypothetical protein
MYLAVLGSFFPLVNGVTLEPSGEGGMRGTREHITLKKLECSKQVVSAGID